MGLLTFRIRGETEHPSFVVTDSVAARAIATFEAGKTPGRNWTAHVTEEGGGETAVALDPVLWVTHEPQVEE